MKFEFNSLDELKQFIQFINQNQNFVIKEEINELKQGTDKLQGAVNNEAKGNK